MREDEPLNHNPDNVVLLRLDISGREITIVTNSGSSIELHDFLDLRVMDNTRKLESLLLQNSMVSFYHFIDCRAIISTALDDQP